jgi:AraC family transcriptional regulator of adaptative response/methylated-DNA-[protein]-cysteine methyltransferase
MNAQAIESARCNHAGKRGEEIHFGIGDSLLGYVLVARSEKGICAILLASDRLTLVRNLQDLFPYAILKDGDTELKKLVSGVAQFVEDPSRDLVVSLDERGTAFQRRVWKALREIPVGSTKSYAEVAAKIGSPKSVRAVAQACAANPLAVVIPCHRILGCDGALSGYRWGTERKKRLLEREAARCPSDTSTTSVRK